MSARSSRRSCGFVVVTNRSGEAQRLDGEDVAPAKRIPMRLHELPPRASLLPFWRRFDSRPGQDVRDRRTTAINAESSAQGVPDFRVAPAKLFRGQLDDQLADMLRLGRTASSGLGAVVLPGGELTEPSKMVAGFTTWQHLRRSSGVRNVTDGEPIVSTRDDTATTQSRGGLWQRRQLLSQTGAAADSVAGRRRLLQASSAPLGAQLQQPGGIRADRLHEQSNVTKPSTKSRQP